MGDATGQRPEDLDGEGKFVRWATSPDGALFEIRGVTGLGVIVPLGLEADSGGAALRRVLGIITKGLVRVQRPRTVEWGAWVSVIPSGGDESVYGLTCENLDEAREHAVDIASKIENGTLRMDLD